MAIHHTFADALRVLIIHMSETNFVPITKNVVMVMCDFVSVTLAHGTRLAIFDTGVAGLMPKCLEPALTHMGCTLADLELIVNTHGHWDHIEGNPALVLASKAQVYIHPADFDKLHPIADRCLADGDRIDLGAGLEFELVAAPGHSAGMACFYNAADGLLIASDAIQGWGGGERLPLYFSSGMAYRASLNRLLQLDAQILILGHAFGWSGTPNMIQRGGDNIRRFIGDSLTASEAIAAAVRAAVGKTPERRFKSLLATVRATLSHEPQYRFDSAATFGPLDQISIWSELHDLGVTYTAD